MDSIKNSGLSASEIKNLRSTAKNIYSHAFDRTVPSKASTAKSVKSKGKGSSYFPRPTKAKSSSKSTKTVKRQNAGISYRGKGNGAFYPRKNRA